MAPNPQLEPRPKPPTRNRDLAYRSSQDVSGPIIAILAIIAFAVALSLVLTTDWSSTSEFPTVSETMPAPDINANVPPVPAKSPPPPGQSKS
jgi:hypothetical protein